MGFEYFEPSSLHRLCRPSILAPGPDLFGGHLDGMQLPGQSKGKGKGRGLKKVGKITDGQAQMPPGGPEASTAATQDSAQVPKPKKPVNFKAKANAKLREGRDMITDAKCWIHTVEKAIKDGKKLFLARDTLPSFFS